MHDNLQLFKWTEQVLVQVFVFLVYMYISGLSVLTQDYRSFSTILIFVFFQDTACKRLLWTEDHFSHRSFVCREDSTWVGVGINSQIQRGRGWHSRSLSGGLCLQTLTLFRQKSFMFKTRNQISWPCFLLFRTQNQVIFKTNVMQLYTYFFEKDKNCWYHTCRPLITSLHTSKRHPVQDGHPK